MNQIQDNLVNMLTEIDQLCRKNDIQYFVAGGTALGMVRGGDFMPWDDDVDIYLTLSNWEKLKKVLTCNLPRNRDFVNEEDTPLYCNPIGRYSDKNTTEFRDSQLLCGRACGQIIEFFIMDPMPESTNEREEFIKKNKTFTELCSPFFSVNREFFGMNKCFDYNHYNNYYKKGRFGREEKVLNELRNKLSENREDTANEFMVRWGLEPLIYNRECASTRLEKLGDYKFPISKKAESIFRYDYGNSWMYIPDDKGIKIHHPARNFEKPYEEYVKLYKPLINEKKVLKAYKNNKRIMIKANIHKEKYQQQMMILKINRWINNFNKNEKYFDELTKAYSNKDFALLNKEFEKYYSLQFDKIAVRDGIKITEPQKYVALAIKNKIAQGRYYDYSRSHGLDSLIPDEEMFTDVRSMYDFCEKLSIAMYDLRSTEEVDDILQQNGEYRDEIVDYRIAEQWIVKQKINSEKDFKFLLESAKESLYLFPDSGEIMGNIASAYYSLGNKEKAKEWYLKALEKTRNGFLWREACVRFEIDCFKSMNLESNNEKKVPNEIKEKREFLIKKGLKLMRFRLYGYNENSDENIKEGLKAKWHKINYYLRYILASPYKITINKMMHSYKMAIDHVELEELYDEKKMQCLEKLYENNSIKLKEEIKPYIDNKKLWKQKGVPFIKIERLEKFI